MLPDLFAREHQGVIPEGLLRTVVPAAPAAWLTALERYGTMSFADVAYAAVTFARERFPIHPLMAQTIADREEMYRSLPSSCAVSLPNGRATPRGCISVREYLERSIQSII